MEFVFTLFLVIGVGSILGSVSIRHFKLGSSAILLVALVGGNFGLSISPDIRDLGLVTFVAAIALSAGPPFFKSFKNRVFSHTVVGILVVSIAAVFCLVTIILFDIPVPLAVGMFSGAMTSTPGLAAAIETTGSQLSSIGYGIAYPFGVLGVVLFVQITSRLLVEGKNDIHGHQDITARTDRVQEERVKSSLQGLGIMAVTIILGLILGKIAIPLPGGLTFSFGLTGGPLFVGLLFGQIVHMGKGRIAVPQELFSYLREYGLAIFLAGAGTQAGQGLLEVLKEQGVMILLLGAVMTLLPMFLAFFIASKLLHLKPNEVLGCICGGMTSTPALGALVDTEGYDEVVASYIATYPVALVCMVLGTQLIAKLCS